MTSDKARQTIDTLWSRAARGAVLVSPSILSANLLDLGAETRQVESAGAHMHHVDVMDGHFVPNLTFGLPLIQSLKKTTSLPLDVHIMITNPDQVAADYVRAGADVLTFHVETATHAVRVAQSIVAAGAIAGVALNPGTSVETIRPLLPFVGMVTVMSVNPGFSNQRFIEASVGRVRAIRSMIESEGVADRVLIEVDGGMDPVTGAAVVAAGASVLVAGKGVYGAPDRARAVADLVALGRSS